MNKRGAWRIGGYVADELIGYGASAQVWRGHASRSSEAVALKVLDLADASAVRAARAEAAILSALDHPHLVHLRELVPDGDSIVLVLELADGGSLAELVQRRGRLTPGEVVAAVAPVAAALAYVHDQGVVHADVSPANILFRSDGTPILADLGVARLVGGFDTPRSTLAYIDPGVAAGAVPSEASDVFMTAATALYALTGAPPWPGDSVETVLAQAATGEIEGLEAQLSGVPATVAEVIRRGLSPSPVARLSAAEFALDLRHCAPLTRVDLGAGRARPPVSSPPARPRVPRAAEGLEQEPGATSRADRSPVAGSPPTRPPVAGAAHVPRHASHPAPPGSDRPPVDRPGFDRPAADRWTATGPASERTEAPDQLALTHIVRARVRTVTPQRARRRWLLARPLGHRIAALTLVVVLAAGGTAWLRWRPAWASVGDRAGAGRSLSSQPAHTPASATATPTPTTPTPTPMTPTPALTTATPTATATTSAPPTTTTGPTAQSMGAAGWRKVLGGLDLRRQQAFATRDVAPLASVYVPGPLLNQDAATLNRVVAPGCRLVGLRTGYRAVHVSADVGGRIVLAAQASLASARLDCPGVPARRTAANGPVPMTLVLVRRGPHYLISAMWVPT